MRIDKLLHDQQFGTRSEIHELIKARRVVVDRKPVKSFKQHVDPVTMQIIVDGSPVVTQAPFVFYLMNKPAGVITATTDVKQPTVMNLIDAPDRRTDLFPVGRLDKDTTGMLLLTNNGQLAHQLVSPKHHVEKTYRVVTTGLVTQEQINELCQGITLRDGAQVMADDATIVSQHLGQTILRLTLHQGKYHQVKRMMGYLGQRVISLHRDSFAGISDSQLAAGQYRMLTDTEVTKLEQH